MLELPGGAVLLLSYHAAQRLWLSHTGILRRVPRAQPTSTAARRLRKFRGCKQHFPTGLVRQTRSPTPPGRFSALLSKPKPGRRQDRLPRQRLCAPQVVVWFPLLACAERKPRGLLAVLGSSRSQLLEASHAPCHTTPSIFNVDNTHRILLTVQLPASFSDLQTQARVMTQSQEGHETEHNLPLLTQPNEEWRPP